MFQRLKVWGLRRYYHYISNRGWKGHIGAPSWNPLQIPGPAGPIHARMYAGLRGSGGPLIVYFHGGGWVIGDLETHHPFCQTLSERSGCTVISVDYRLAPEHPFPAALEDCLAATRWIGAHIGDFGPSNHTLVVAGDSAGGNLALCTCLELDAVTRAMVAGEVVKYPVVDHYRADPPSYTERAKGQALTSDFMVWFWDTYLGTCPADSPRAQRAMPLHSDRLDSLPSTFLITAEFDPLRDEGIALAAKLGDAGIPLYHRHFETAAHGFACSEGPNENFEAYMSDLLDWLQRLH